MTGTVLRICVIALVATMLLAALSFVIVVRFDLDVGFGRHRAGAPGGTVRSHRDDTATRAPRSDEPPTILIDKGTPAPRED